MTKKAKLFFGWGNAKLADSIATLSLPAGWSCPFANLCFSKADRFTGQITDGKNMEFRCYAASHECTYTSVRQSRWNNFELLKAAVSIENMANLIQRSLPFGSYLVRLHPAGDFYSEKYFLAWLNVALSNPATVFYGYTKALPFLVKYKRDIPKNFRFTASYGGTHDHLIAKHRMKYAKVVFSTEEARRAGLEIDHDDSHAFGDSGSFALLLHGTQPPGTDANEAWKQLRRQDIGNYNEDKKNARMERNVEIQVTLK
jgi:hypothetical protein